MEQKHISKDNNILSNYSSAKPGAYKQLNKRGITPLLFCFKNRLRFSKKSDIVT